MDSIVPIIETSSATKGVQTFANKMTELENCFQKRKKKRSKKGNPTKEWFKKTCKTQNFLKKRQRTTGSDVLEIQEYHSTLKVIG